MSYLPNSIERCAPIVGFDPYAFIMDRPSNLLINKMQSPYDVDYYATGPKNEPQTPEEPAPQPKKKGGILKIIKIGAAIASVIALGVLIGRGVHRLRGGKAPTSRVGKFLHNAWKTFKKGFNHVKNFAQSAYNRVKNFITRRP